MIEQARAQCPYCWEVIALEVDCSAGDAEYTEDCPVCCQPMLVAVRAGLHGRYTVEVRREND